MSKHDIVACPIEHFVRMCKLERDKHPLSPLPPTRKMKRRRAPVVDRYDYDGAALSFLLQPQAG